MPPHVSTASTTSLFLLAQRDLVISLSDLPNPGTREFEQVWLSLARRIIHAFQTYALEAEVEVARWEKNIRKLSPELRASHNQYCARG